MSKNRHPIDVRYRELHRTEMRKRSSDYRKQHPLFQVHTGMMQRCGHYAGAGVETLKNYKDRGICVCEEWRKFKNFENWAVSNGWEKGLQVDRIDNDLGYCPDNCRFVSNKINMRNTRATTKIVVLESGLVMNAIDFYENGKFDFSYDVFRKRLNSGEINGVKRIKDSTSRSRHGQG